jgi:hypothetical protein
MVTVGSAKPDMGVRFSPATPNLTAMPVCIKCKTDKPNSAFHRRTKGGTKLQHTCKECQLKYAAQHYRSNKASYIARNRVFRKKMQGIINVLKAVPCLDCGGTFPPYVMDFDHRGDKKINISRSLGRLALEDVLAEIAKCDLVCANCHRIRTHRRGWPNVRQ